MRHSQGGGDSCSGSGRTWVTGLTISTQIVAGDIVDEILKSLLVARLLALVERTVHGSRFGGIHG